MDLGNARYAVSQESSKELVNHGNCYVDIMLRHNFRFSDVLS